MIEERLSKYHARIVGLGQPKCWEIDGRSRHVKVKLKKNKEQAQKRTPENYVVQLLAYGQK